MSKASKLSIIRQKGFNVPKFVFVKGLNYKLPFKADKYIVRSSFNIEDSSNSFAGVFKSYGPINESEIDSCLKKVLKVTMEAKTYYKKLGLHKNLIPGAIIQEYISSKSGGVCFTNQNSTIIIESGKNVELITSGKGVDATYKISRLSLDVKNIPIPITKLVTDALDIESIFKKPQDIEWLNQNKIYILQTREAKQINIKQPKNLNEFLSIIPPSVWDRYLAFSFEYSNNFKKISYGLIEKIIRLELFDWTSIMLKSYRNPKGKTPIYTFKDSVVNYGYYGLLNQITEDGSLAMKRIDLSVKRLGLNYDTLLDYAINRKQSIYSKIIKNPEKYNETFVEDIKIANAKYIKRHFVRPTFSERERKVADFFALLYDIKGYGAVYHDYYISPILTNAYKKLPKDMKNETMDYIDILERQGFTLPDLNRVEQKFIPNYLLPQSLTGKVGINILVYKDVTPEAVLKLKHVKCIISEEGGILSHAAILAREFNIPFISGIKNATKLFQNGDTLNIKPRDESISIHNMTKDKYLEVNLK